MDEENLRKLVTFLRDNVDGLFICGSYGSGPMMSIEERKKVAEITVEVVNGAIPVVAHTGTTSTRDTVELSLHAREVGCDSVASVGPFYFHHGPDSVIDYYTGILNAVGPDYPVYVYNNPAFSGYAISLDTLKRLKEAGVCGVKDATFDIMIFAAYMRELADDNFDVVLGTESMWASARALGAEAYIPGLGNAFPEICRQMHREGMKDDVAACRETQFVVNKMRDIMYLAKSTQLAVYAMLGIRGIVDAYPRSPFIPASRAEIDSIRNALLELKVI
ncbi:MAG: dihydrodipicolinate synthase family protein [Bacteroidales bacterium]|nr:dihydrodipicolinate synthase family protein [Bacteroidales bacterium]